MSFALINMHNYTLKIERNNTLFYTTFTHKFLVKKEHTLCMSTEWSSVSFHIKSHISYQIITPTGSRLSGHTSRLMMDIHPAELHFSGLLHSKQW